MLLEAAGLTGEVATAGGIAGAVTSAVIGVVKYFDHRKGTRRDRQHADSSKQLQAAMERLGGTVERLGTTMEGGFKTLDGRIDTLEKGVTRVEHFCIGPDGENGFRGDIREIKNQIKGFEDRERERLQQKALHAYDRRDTA